jgi:hypothetical protein
MATGGGHRKCGSAKREGSGSIWMRRPRRGLPLAPGHGGGKSLHLRMRLRPRPPVEPHPPGFESLQSYSSDGARAAVVLEVGDDFWPGR